MSQSLSSKINHVLHALEHTFPDHDGYEFDFKQEDHCINFFDDGWYQGRFNFDTYEFEEIVPCQLRDIPELQLAVATVKQTLNI